MNSKKHILIIAYIIINVSFAKSQSSSKCWSNFRGDSRLSGVTTSTIPDKFSILWSFKTGAEIKSSPVICDNSIFVGSTDGNLYALSLSGKLLWKFNTVAGIEAPPLIHGGFVIVGAMDGFVYALNSKTGKLKWKYQTEGQISGSANPVTIKNKSCILIPSYDYALHCINLSDGKLVWKCETDNYLNGAPATDNKKAVIGGCDAKIHIINTETGKETGFINVETYVAASSVINGDKAYMGDYDGNFLCVDLVKKSIVWKYSNTQTSPFIASPAFINNKVIIGSHDKKVYCFNAKTGKIEWTCATFGKIESSPVISFNKVLICSKDGWIRVISSSDGKEIYKYELGIPVTSTPAVVDKLIVIGGTDGKIYGLGKK